MSSIDNFLSESYSEELYAFTEEEYSEVMAASTEDENFAGYSDWSESLEGDLENLEVVGGKVHYKGEQVKRGPFVGGIEV